MVASPTHLPSVLCELAGVEREASLGVAMSEPSYPVVPLGYADTGLPGRLTGSWKKARTFVAQRFRANLMVNLWETAG